MLCSCCASLDMPLLAEVSPVSHWRPSAMGECPPRSASQPAQLHRQLAASPRSSPRGASQPAQSRWPPASFASSSPCVTSQPAQAQPAEVHTAILTWAWSGDEHRVDLTKVPRGDWSTALSQAALELTNDPSEHFCTCVKEMAEAVSYTHLTLPTKRIV